MDTSDSEIEFDQQGHCNHCNFYFAHTVKELPEPEVGAEQLERIVAQIKAEGEGKPYDCVIGLSGGVDSSFVALRVAELGLRPVAVHLDNSWDAEVAVRNIERIVRSLDLDLITHVVDWQEFRDIQRAFFKASVVDIEMITDHAITALVNDVARDHGLHWVVSGTNHATESIMPVTWTHRKSDLRNLKAIHRRFGERPMKTLPTMSMLEIQYAQRVRRFRSLSILNYAPYSRQGAIDALERDLGWQNYGGKHFESLFTRFYQAHYLPEKFGIDKRRAHFSAAICSGLKDRDEAIAELDAPVYPPRDLAHDRDYLLKKLGFTPAEWEAIMAAPPESHLDYPSDEAYIGAMLKVKALGRRVRS
ncbi:MAG: N-acetyl sugar amidotransferase [Thermoleophilaceae bacterium]|nr:N-acetyl sugar amidotransferase [Thermoleophilaceae bacterium]